MMIGGGKVCLSDLGLCCENVENSNGVGTLWDLFTTVVFEDEFKWRHPKTVGHDFGGLRLDSQSYHGSNILGRDCV